MMDDTWGKILGYNDEGQRLLKESFEIHEGEEPEVDDEMPEMGMGDEMPEGEMDMGGEPEMGMGDEMPEPEMDMGGEPESLMSPEQASKVIQSVADALGISVQIETEAGAPGEEVVDTEMDMGGEPEMGMGEEMPEPEMGGEPEMDLDDEDVKSLQESFSKALEEVLAKKSKK